MLKIYSRYLVLLVLFFVGCQSATKNTRTLNQETKANDQNAVRVSVLEKNSAEPAITSDSEGNVYVVFVEHEGKLADIYLQKFDKDAKPIGDKVRVNPEEGSATAWFGDAPTIKIGNENKIFIGWTAKDANAGKSNANILNLSVSRDGGKSFDAPVKVNDDTAPSSHGMHSLAIDKNDNVFVVWLDERNVKSEVHAQNFVGDTIIELQTNSMPNDFRYIKAHAGENHNSSNEKAEKLKTESGHSEMKNETAEPNSEIFFAVSKNGGKSFSKNIKISSEVCPCCKTSLAINGNGKIYASWRQVVGDNFRHIAVASSENVGESFSDYTIVSDDQWQISACPVSGAPMFIDKDNNLNIFWFTGGKAGKPGLYTAESKDGGGEFSPRNLVFEGAVKGTLSVFAKGENDFSAFFDGMGKVFQADQNLKPQEKFAGELPSAIFTNGNTYVAFIKNENKKNSVWLARF